MSEVDFSVVRKYLKMTDEAADLLATPERQLILHLSVNLDRGKNVIVPAYVVYHNTARGPAKGGLRMQREVTLEETTRLAELMSWKAALARLPFGGGKSGIAIDPGGLSALVKRNLIQEFVHLIRPDIFAGAYIPAPDLGTGALEMAWIYGETHMPESVTGKPPRVGGLLGRLEATGRGVAAVTQEALKCIFNQDTAGRTIAVQGFGTVGSYAALFLHRAGARVVAVSHVSGGLHNPKGLDIPALMKHAGRDRTLEGASGGDTISNDDLLTLPVDVLAPCAIGHVLTAQNAAKVRARLVVEGANAPTAPEADRILAEGGLPIVPDILANAGGVIASYLEWSDAKSGRMSTAEETFAEVEGNLGRSFDEVLGLSRQHKISLRAASHVVAVREVMSAMQDRGWI